MAMHLEQRRLVLRAGMRLEHPVDASIVADNVRIVSTNGTTAVNVFGAQGAPFAGTITGAYSNALDTTAGNITLKTKTNSVVVIAKGTTAGVIVGNGALSNTTFAPGDVVTIVSSSAGNSQMQIFYTVAVPTDV